MEQFNLSLKTGDEGKQLFCLGLNVRKFTNKQSQGSNTHA